METPAGSTTPAFPGERLSARLGLNTTGPVPPRERGSRADDLLSRVQAGQADLVVGVSRTRVDSTRAAAFVPTDGHALRPPD